MILLSGQLRRRHLKSLDKEIRYQIQFSVSVGHECLNGSVLGSSGYTSLKIDRICNCVSFIHAIL